MPVTYQWLFNGNPLANGGGISGAQSATLTISGVTLAEIGNYSVIATNTTHLDQYVTSQSAGLSTSGLNLFPVITINGIPGSTYTVQYANSLSGPWNTLATYTFGNVQTLQYAVDTATPLAIARFYRVVQN